MSLDAIGFVLTVAGVPYLFTTGALPALSSTSPLWFGGEDDVQELEGWLVWPSGWSERAKPLDGDLDASSVTFRLHDATAGAGVASGHPALTWLATRFPQNVTSSPLALNLTAGATSMTVSSGAALGSVPRWVWCEREAMRVSSRSGDVLTVARGALGTQAAAHTIDTDAGRLPEVFADVPWILRRKAVLWAVDSSGVAHPVWIGFAVRSPRLSDDGARFDMPCDPLWLVLQQNPVGNPDAVLRVVGYGRNGVTDTSTSTPTVARLGVTYTGAAVTAYATANGHYRTLDALRARLVTELQAATAAVLGTAIAYVDVRFSGNTCTVTLDHTASFGASLHLFGQNTSASWTARGARYTAQLQLEGVARSNYLILNSGSGEFLLESLVNAPASWAVETTTANGLTTTRIPTLRAALSKDLWATVSGVTASTGATDGALVAGTTQILPRKPGTDVPDTAWLTDSPGFNVCRRVTTDHWLDGLRYGAADLLADAGADDFDWSTADAVRRLTTGLSVRRDWLFDGRATFGRVAVECCQLSGCTPVTRGGRLAFFPWSLPDARAVAAVTLARNDLLGDPTWQTWDEGLANRIKVTSDDLIIDATDAGSINRYGPGRQIKTDLLGRDTSTMAMGDPIAFSRQVLGRMSLWADPLGIAKIRVSLSHLTDLELGAVASVTDWLIPNGAGGRGLSAAFGVVVAREVTIDGGAGSIALDLILFPRVSYGYAPCARVASRSSTTTVLISQTTVGGAAGYSGSDDTATFAAGDKVQLVLRDSTTLTTQDLTVQSVNVASHTITFTGAINGTFQTAIDGGATVDVRFAHYASVQASQASWMFVGDDTTRVIDSTTDPARAIAP